MLTKCGMDCKECPSFPKECPGCEAISGKPFWTQYIGGGPCTIYQCCQDKTYKDCGQCIELPCKIWYDLKDPALSDEEHINSINRRAALLKKK